MAIGFTIPINTDDLAGNEITNGATTIQVNSVKETYNVSFTTRPKADIDDIVGYLDSLKGVTAFSFTIPDSNGSEASGTETTIKVVCDDFSITYDSGDFYSASAKFRRVYEA